MKLSNFVLIKLYGERITPNARGIFILIAGHQLEEKDNNSYIGEKFVNSSLDREQYVIAIFFSNLK